MKKTKDDAELTRGKILDAAMLVFNRDGYANSRLEDIAAEAGVTRGAVYHHFGGKPDVYMALVDERFHESGRVIEESLRKGGTPKEMLKNILTSMFVYLEENKEYRLVQELVIFKTGYAPELQAGMEYKTEIINNTVEFIKGLIDEGVRKGEFSAVIDPHAAAISAVGLFNGVSMLWILDSRQFSVKEYAEKIVNIYIKGLES